MADAAPPQPPYRPPPEDSSTEYPVQGNPEPHLALVNAPLGDILFYATVSAVGPPVPASSGSGASPPPQVELRDDKGALWQLAVRLPAPLRAPVHIGDRVRVRSIVSPRGSFRDEALLVEDLNRRVLLAMTDGAPLPMEGLTINIGQAYGTTVEKFGPATRTETRREVILRTADRGAHLGTGWRQIELAGLNLVARGRVRDAHWQGGPLPPDAYFQRVEVVIVRIEK